MICTMMQRTISVLLSCGTLISSLVAVPASAQEQAAPLQINNESNVADLDKFYIGPTRFLLNMEPGETRTVEVQIINQEGERGEYVLVTEDFAIDPDRRRSFRRRWPGRIPHADG